MHMFKVYFTQTEIKRLQHFLFVRYQDLKVLVYKQEARNLTLHLAAPWAVFNCLVSFLQTRAWKSR